MKMATIFISYRRADSASETGRIYDRLVERYGRERVFKDVDSIPPGANFPEYITSSIQASDIALIVIGPRWLDASTGFGQRRLDDPADYVRIEIETALRLGVPVVPVLLTRATMPPARRLPESLRPLRLQNSVAVRQDPDFSHDMERVFAAIDYWQAQPRRAPTPTEPAPESAMPAPTLTSAPAPVTTAPPEAPAEPERRGDPDALARLLGIAASQKDKRRPHQRLGPVLAIAVALLLIAGGVVALLSGVPALIFAAQAGENPNAHATQTASAQTTQRAQWSTTETALTVQLAQDYNSPGVGPCDKNPGETAGAPVALAPSNSATYWSWTSGVACAKDGKTAEVSHGGSLFFSGRPAGFPHAFTATITGAFPTASADNCVEYFMSTASDMGTGAYVSFCADGSVSYIAPGGPLATPTAKRLPAPNGVFTIAYVVTETTCSLRVNGVSIYSSHDYTPPVVRLTIYGTQNETLAVQSFQMKVSGV